jgi:hypothetical protein
MKGRPFFSLLGGPGRKFKAGEVVLYTKMLDQHMARCHMPV